MSQALQANFRQAYTKDEASGLFIPQSLLTTRGDLIRRGASAPERVALGASGSALMSDGTDAVWRTKAQRHKVGGFTVPGSTGNVAVSGIGFSPSLVTFETVYNDDAYIFRGAGAMDSGGGQWAIAYTSFAGVEAERAITDGCIYLVTTAGTSSSRGAFVSMDSDGFTVNLSVVDGTTRVKWIAHA